jgi:hypothetical protein
MLIVCPVCSHSNTVIDNYAPGSILACKCGAFLQFTSASEPPTVLPKGSQAFPISTRRSKPKPQAS